MGDEPKEKICWKCGERVPYESRECPHCDAKFGYNRGSKEESMMINGVAAAILGVIIIIILIAYNVNGNGDNDTKYDKDLKAVEKAIENNDIDSLTPDQKEIFYESQDLDKDDYDK